MHSDSFAKNLVLPIALSLVLMTVWLSGQFSPDGLRYDRLCISNGEFWRVFTSHLTHMGATHLVLNIIGLFMVFLVFGHFFPTRFWILNIMAGMAAISLGLYLFHPELDWYMGLSGVLHGLMVAGSMGAIRNKRRWGYFALASIAAKLAWEQIYGPSPGMVDMIHSPVIVDAHLYGAVTGLLTVLSCFLGKALTGHSPEPESQSSLPDGGSKQ